MKVFKLKAPSLKDVSKASDIVAKKGCRAVTYGL